MPWVLCESAGLWAAVGRCVCRSLVLGVCVSMSISLSIRLKAWRSVGLLVCQCQFVRVSSCTCNISVRLSVVQQTNQPTDMEYLSLRVSKGLTSNWICSKHVVIFFCTSSRLQRGCLMYCDIPAFTISFDMSSKCSTRWEDSLET